MKIVIASDSFKGSLTTMQVAQNIEIGIRRVLKDVVIEKIAVADGGEGTVEAIINGGGGEIRKSEVCGPDGNKVVAKFGILKNGDAIIEMAEASGIELLKGKLDVVNSTTFGTGQLVLKAIELGCKTIFIGIGGSATNDGGMGFAQALGVRFKDKHGNELGFGGINLSKLETIDCSKIDKRVSQTKIIAMSDVDNVLCGKNGAAFVYGPQKGATKETAKMLDENLKHYAKIIEAQLGKNVKDVAGSGAAGGLGAGLIAFTNAQIQSGIETILQVVGFEEKIKNAQIIITGEGSLDSQSIRGKVPIGVAKIATKHGVPVAAIVGSISKGANEVYKYGIEGVFSAVCRPMSLEKAIQQSETLLQDASERAIRAILMGQHFIKTKNQTN